MEELNDFNDKPIWQLEDLRNVLEIADAVHVRTRWVLCNKGDEANPDTRARLVACEINKTGKEDALYASTPPGESKNMLFSWYASRRHQILPDGSTVPLRLSCIDIILVKCSCHYQPNWACLNTLLQSRPDASMVQDMLE